jgi:hypothetical protein
MTAEVSSELREANVLMQMNADGLIAGTYTRERVLCVCVCVCV